MSSCKRLKCPQQLSRWGRSVSTPQGSEDKGKKGMELLNLAGFEQCGISPQMVVLTCSPSMEEVDTGGSGIHGHSQLHSRFEDSLGNMRAYLKRKKEQLP